MSADYTVLRDAALAYAREGHRIFPVSKGKEPLLPKPAPGDPVLPLADWQDSTKGAFHQGICDPDLVSVWWSVLHRGAGIALALPPDMVVIDIDGEDQLERLKRRHPTLYSLLPRSDTFTVSTPRGRHYYFRLREDQALVTQTHARGLAGDGGDVRFCVDVKAGSKGFAVLPPTSVGRGGQYEVMNGSLDGIAEMPDAWHEALVSWGQTRTRRSGIDRSRHQASLRPSEYAPEVNLLDDDPRGESKRKLPPGTGRHPILHPRVCALRAKGTPADVALSQARAWNELWFEEPKDDEKIIALITDTYERYPGPERAAELPQGQHSANENTEQARPNSQAEVLPAEGAYSPPTDSLAEIPPESVSASSGSLVLPVSAAGLRRGLIHLHATLRQNVRADCVEVSRGGGSWTPLVGVESIRLAEDMAENFREGPAHRDHPPQWRPTSRHWMEWTQLIAHEREEDPWRAWLDQLPESGGGLTLVPGDGIGRQALIGALVTAVARAYEPGAPFPHLPVLMGVECGCAREWWRSLFDADWCYAIDYDLRSHTGERARALAGPVIIDVCGLGEPRTTATLKSLLLSASSVRNIGRLDERHIPRRSVAVACDSSIPDDGFCVPVKVALRPLDHVGRRRLWRGVLDYYRRHKLVQLNRGAVTKAAAFVKTRAAGSVYEQVAIWAAGSASRAARGYTNFDVAKRAGTLNKNERRLDLKVHRDVRSALEDAGWTKRQITIAGRRDRYWIRPGAPDWVDPKSLGD